MAKVILYHNILWSKYKGNVFGALNALSLASRMKFYFTQIAETEGDRINLSSVDMSYHNYPYTLLFEGQYEKIPRWKLVRVLSGAVWTSDADLIVLPGFHKIEFWAMLLAAVIRQKKRAVFCDSTVFDNPQTLAKSIAKRIFFKLCNGYFGYGIRSRQYLIANGANSENIFHRCQAAALPHDYSAEQALFTRELNALATLPPRFLYVGRLSKEKGLFELISAFGIIIKRIPAARLILVGSGPLREQLEAHCLSLRVADSVIFTGGMTIAEISLEYAKAACLVLPSSSEPWGLVVNEALSYGCPVVVSNVCGCVPELVIEGITGYKFPVGDSVALASAMLRVVSELALDRGTAKRCIDHISDFSPENAAKQILLGCEKILAG